VNIFFLFFLEEREGGGTSSSVGIHNQGDHGIPVWNSAGIFYFHTFKLPSKLALNSTEFRKEKFDGIHGIPRNYMY
jgi:hypothetical protein